MTANGPCVAPAPARHQWRACVPIDEADQSLLHLRLDLEYQDTPVDEIQEGQRLVLSLVPHFRRAFELLQRDLSPSTPADILEVFSGKLAILKRSGQLIRCNKAFTEFLATANLVTIDPANLVSFEALPIQHQFQTALVHPKPSAFLVKSEKTEQLVVTIHPLNQEHLGAQSATHDHDEERKNLVLMWIRPKQPESISMQFLQHLYGLTRAETRVTEYVVQGLTLDEIGEKIGISKITARNQLTSAMSKLGVNRQAQLVTLILNMFPGLKGS